MLQLPREKSAGLIAARFDGLTLLLKQSQVSAIDQIENAAGYEWPIHTLSGTLNPIAAKRPFYVVLHHPDGEFGLACEEVNVISNAGLELHGLPDVMRSYKSPFTAFARLREGLGFLCPAEALASVLNNSEFSRHGH